MSFSIKRKIRFGDCDPAGVLYTPRISYIVVEAILDFVTERIGTSAEKGLMDHDILPPAKAFSVEFIKPLVWDDIITIQVAVKEIRNSAIVYTVHGIKENELAFKAEMTQVCISKS